jgi:hypothetical protein
MKTFKDLEVTIDKHQGISASTFFDNGYGVSVTMGPFTKGGLLGKYELAVIKFPPGQTFTVIDYNTPVGGPLGHLSEDDVTEYMAKVQELPKIN